MHTMHSTFFEKNKRLAQTLIYIYDKTKTELSHDAPLQIHNYL